MGALAFELDGEPDSSEPRRPKAVGAFHDRLALRNGRRIGIRAAVRPVKPSPRNHPTGVRFRTTVDDIRDDRTEIHGDELGSRAVGRAHGR